MPYMLRTLFKI